MKKWMMVVGLLVCLLYAPACSYAVMAGEQVATESGMVEERSDLTQTQGVAAGKLEGILREQPMGELKWNNVLQQVIRRAVDRGVPATTIVLILAFPLAAAIIAASRHLIGLQGFGIFIPAVLSVAFVASGIGSGLLLFGVILLVATVGRVILKRLRLQYLPRMALLLWLVSLGVFGVMVVAPEVGLGEVAVVGIFPVLILILLAENFIEVQMTKSMQSAINLTLETLVLAVIAAGILGLPVVQKYVLLNPEMVVVGVAVFDFFMGRYVGLRFKEYLQFRGLTEK